MKHSYMLTAKITPEINESNSPTVGDSLHVWRNFSCLIMAPTN